MTNNVQRVQSILNRVKLHPTYPYTVEFVANDAGQGQVQVEARATMISVETGQLQKGIVPEFCSVNVPADADEQVVARGAHDALAKFASHEVSESVTFDGKNVVEPHPSA